MGAAESEASPGPSKLGDDADSAGLTREQALREQLSARGKSADKGERQKDAEDTQPGSKRRKLDDLDTNEDGETRGHGRETATRSASPSQPDGEPPSQPAQLEATPYRPAPSWSALHRSSHPSIAPSRSIYSYERLNHIQEGTYGVVFRARPRDAPPASPSSSSSLHSAPTQRDVAVKKLKLAKNGLDHSGFPITSLREIQALTLARPHRSVVRLHEVCIGKTLDQIFLVMEFVEHDLKTLLTSLHRAKSCFAPSEVKTLLHQLLTATQQLHADWIVHRDLKTSNLLMDNRGRLKVADFGLARRYGDPIDGWVPAVEPRRRDAVGKSDDGRHEGEREGEGGMTDLVVTLWYRAPELLLLNQLHAAEEEQAERDARRAQHNGAQDNHGSTSASAANDHPSPAVPLYDEKIDMWSIGCIFAELLLTSQTGGGLFQGKDEADQLRRIRSVLGAPNTTIWPDLPLFSTTPHPRPAGAAPSRSAMRREEERIKASLAAAFRPMRLTTATVDLLFRLLHYDPKQRISAADALQHEYFTVEPPKMAHPDSFGSFPSMAAGEAVPYDTPSAPPHRVKADPRSGAPDYPLEFAFDL